MPVNEQIQALEVRAIDENGHQIGIIKTKEALSIARSRGFDLVMVSPNSNPPVCKIMDYGRHKYEQEKRIKGAKKKQHTVNIKEITVSYKIGEHDYQVRLKRLKDFIVDGNKVKMTVRLRGREEQHSNLAIELLERYALDSEDVAIVERPPLREGKNVIMILTPKK